MAVAQLAAVLRLQPTPAAPDQLTVACVIRLARSGSALRLVGADGTRQEAEPSNVLIRLIAQGHRYWHELRQGELQIGELAARKGISRAYVARLLRLTFLSPAVVDAVLAGAQRTGLNAEAIKAVDVVNPDWNLQAAVFLPADLQSSRGDLILRRSG